MNRFQFVTDHQERYGVKRLCQVLGVARSSYYYWTSTVLPDPGRRTDGGGVPRCVLPPRLFGHSLQLRVAARHTSLIKVLRRPVELALGSMITVEDRPGRAATGSLGLGERVDDQFGVQVVGDRPTGEAA